MKLNNWMSEIDGKRDLLTLSIPGTHDCVTKFVQFEHISKTQDLTIAEQLNLGIRALDIRVESRGKALKWCMHSQRPSPLQTNSANKWIWILY